MNDWLNHVFSILLNLNCPAQGMFKLTFKLIQYSLTTYNLEEGTFYRLHFAPVIKVGKKCSIF